VYDKDKFTVFHFNNPEETFSKLFQVPFNQKDTAVVCFNKKQDLGNIYDKENNKYTFFALGKPFEFKGVYFCGLEKGKGKVESFEVKDELNSPKVIIQNNNNNFVILFKFEESSCFYC
jgi:hypothetical protein